MLVRWVRREDRTGWLRLWTEYHAYGTGATAMPDAVTRVTWERFFQEHEPMEALVAELEGRLVGFAHMVFHNTTSAAAASCFLQDLSWKRRCTVGELGAPSSKRSMPTRRWRGGARLLARLETNAAAVRLCDKVASRSGHVVYRKDL